MVLSRGIAFSFVLHVIIVTAAVSLNGRSAIYRAPADYIMVSFLNEIAGGSKDAESKKLYIRKEKTAKKEVKEASNATESPKKSATISDEKPVSPKGTDTQIVSESLDVSSGNNADESDGITLAQNIGKGLPDKMPISGNASAVSDYSLIRIAIEQAKTYPYLARKRRHEGTVIAEFIINANGQPENIKIVKSSGHEILDSETMNIIKRAAPFPHIKEPIEIPITFSLKE